MLFNHVREPLGCTTYVPTSAMAQILINIVMLKKYLNIAVLFKVVGLNSLYQKASELTSFDRSTLSRFCKATNHFISQHDCHWQTLVGN